ncbi:MAG: phosphate signaling complex protein PhoU [Opitutales bacterium]
MKRYFHNELSDIRSKLVHIGEQANEASRIAVEGLLDSDLEKVRHALTLDDEIDELENEIAHAAVRYVTLRAPVSSDVRLIFVAIKASHDFERVGDEAHGIAKKAKSILSRDGRFTHAANIEEMSRLAFALIRDAISCFVEEDVEKARAIIERDEDVDRLNQENFHSLANEVPENADEASTRVETILISKSLERIADHAKNLAEEVIYLLTGESPA